MDRLNWPDIIKDIKKSLSSRNLKQPSRRLNALDKIETILRDHLPKYLENPQENFRKIDKAELKKTLAKYKETGSLNDAESSIINEIYYRI